MQTYKEIILKMIYVFFRDTKFEFFRFVLFAGIAAVISLLAYIIFTFGLSIYYPVAVVLSHLFGGVVNFTLNKYLNFRGNKGRLVSQFFVFFLVNMGGLLGNLLITVALTEYLELFHLISRVIAMCIVLFYSFTMHKFITFRKKNE